MPRQALLPEALEKWPVVLFELLIPRHLDIIYEVNRRFLDDVRARYPHDDARVSRMSLIEEEPVRKVRMAHLAVVGTHSTNGVAEIHSRLLRTRVLSDFAEMLPERFNNKTNGVTPRRWLLMANPPLAALITDCIGDGWTTDLSQLRDLSRFASDPEVRRRLLQAKRAAKLRFVDWLTRSTGRSVDPDSIFDSQIKRIHEYKRQLLNVLHIVMLYDRLRTNPGADVPPRTFLFSGKAAPAYRFAKLIIKLINDVAATIDADAAVRDRIRVLFLPDYRVSLAERLVPASDVSEQISTAGFEASGTGNMKFMMNGALTIGTRDGATIEMAYEAGESNMFLFGLTAEQVAASRDWYDPFWHFENQPAVRRVIDLILSGEFNREEPDLYAPIGETLLQNGDYYMHLADFESYAEAHTRVAAEYGMPGVWADKVLRNIAGAGRFSSDRAVREYAAEIWQAAPCPVP